jgi:hypothetical protein
MTLYLGSAGLKRKGLNVMAGLVPAIHVFLVATTKDVDARHIWREDALRAFGRA